MHITAFSTLFFGSTSLISGCSSKETPTKDELLLSAVIDHKQQIIDEIVASLHAETFTSSELQLCEVILHNHTDHLNALIRLAGTPLVTSSRTTMSTVSTTKKDFQSIVADSTEAAKLRLKQVSQTQNSQIIRTLILIGACEATHSEMKAFNE